MGYLAAGAAGNLLSVIKSPNRSLGASGAVFGVRIMDTIVNKFVTLKDRIPKLLTTHKAHTDRAASSARAHLNANGEPSDGVRAASPARIH